MLGIHDDNILSEFVKDCFSLRRDCVSDGGSAAVERERKEREMRRRTAAAAIGCFASCRVFFETVGRRD
jgi:hypothetical protein